MLFIEDNRPQFEFQKKEENTPELKEMYSRMSQPQQKNKPQRPSDKEKPGTADSQERARVYM